MVNHQPFSHAAALYKAQLQDGQIKATYEKLLKYTMTLKARFATEMDGYQFGNVSPGYMDFSYFPFFNSYLRNRKLRFGIVLNHSQLRFELWLMGQNAEVQARYWELLKATPWNSQRTQMPRYSVLEAILVEEPNWDNLDGLSATIIAAAKKETAAITTCLEGLE